MDGCPVGGAEGAIAVANVMGVEVDLNATRKVARVRCKGTYTDSKEKYNYSGIADCFAASQVFAGHKECQYGCLGHGTCAKACPFGAIDIVDRVAVINEDKCQACEKCISACPKQLIEMVPVDKRYTVGCRSLDKGGVVRKYCSVGCIAVPLCQGLSCGSDYYAGAVAYIDPTKCKLGACEKNVRPRQFGVFRDESAGCLCKRRRSN